MFALVLSLAGSTQRAFGLHKSALDEIAAQYKSHTFKLLVDLHEPDMKADSMQAPSLEADGWHHHNPEGPILYKAGTLMEVTGIFNYAEKGLFLELSEPGKEPPASRPRIRIRIMIETAGTDPAGQAAEALPLIARVLETVAIP